MRTRYWLKRGSTRPTVLTETGQHPPPVPAPLPRQRKEHIANREQTWYKLSSTIESLNRPLPVCPARESSP